MGLGRVDLSPQRTFSQATVVCKDSIIMKLRANLWNIVNDGCMATGTEKIFRVPGKNRTHDFQSGILKIFRVPLSVAKQPSFTSFTHGCIQRHAVFRVNRTFLICA